MQVGFNLFSLEHLLKPYHPSFSDQRTRANGRGVDSAVLHAVLPVRLQPRQQADLRGHLPVLPLRPRLPNRRVPCVPHSQCNHTLPVHLHRRYCTQLEFASMDGLDPADLFPFPMQGHPWFGCFFSGTPTAMDPVSVRLPSSNDTSWFFSSQNKIVGIPCSN